MNFMLVVFTGLLIGLLYFCSMREHLLNMLLSLEFMVLFIFFLFIMNLFHGYYFYSLIYLVITACEGCLGLSILVMMSRSHGGDYLKSMILIN